MAACRQTTHYRSRNGCRELPKRVLLFYSTERPHARRQGAGKVRCPGCSADVGPRREFCPNCGAAMDPGIRGSLLRGRNGRPPEGRKGIRKAVLVGGGAML